jgi:hypothetical protein
VSARRPAAALVLALAACAGGPPGPVVDLTPYRWTWSQAAVGGLVVRYGHPDEAPPAEEPQAPASFAVLPLDGAAGGTRFASHRYGCAQAERAPEAGCDALLELWLLALEPPLPAATLAAWRERVEGGSGARPVEGRPVLHELVSDPRGREWLRRSLTLASGAALSQLSRPLDARRVLVVASSTSRTPDRIAARDLARDAVARVRVEALAGIPR